MVYLAHATVNDVAEVAHPQCASVCGAPGTFQEDGENVSHATAMESKWGVVEARTACVGWLTVAPKRS